MVWLKTFNLKNKGFIIAELLVVISIISLFASITFVSTRKVTEKAKITTVYQFSTQVHHALGAYSEGIWDFESNINDSSGYGHCTDWRPSNSEGTCQPTGVPPEANFKCEKNDTPIGIGCSLDFPGNYYISSPTSTIPGTPSVPWNTINNVTVSLWFNVADSNFRWIFAYKSGDYGQGAEGWGLRSYNGRIAIYDDIDGNDEDGVYDSTATSISQNTWYHVVMSLAKNANGLYENKLWLNARLVGSGNLSGNNSGADGWSSFSAGTIRIGLYSIFSPIQSFVGKIDEVRIYSEALSYAQIQKLYAEGIKKHLTTNNEQ